MAGRRSQACARALAWRHTASDRRDAEAMRAFLELRRVCSAKARMLLLAGIHPETRIPA